VLASSPLPSWLDGFLFSLRNTNLFGAEAISDVDVPDLNRPASFGGVLAITGAVSVIVWLASSVEKTAISFWTRKLLQSSFRIGVVGAQR